MKNNKESATNLNKMRKVAKITSAILRELAGAVKPGLSLVDLDKMAEKLLEKYEAESFNKGYHPSWAKTPYPSALCTSVNNCIAHGLPTLYKLKEGDIINIDIGIKHDGHCGDSALTVPVGKISKKHQDLLKYSRHITYEAIRLVKDNVEVSKIGSETMKTAHKLGYKTNWMLGGHAIGLGMHEVPSIPFHVASGNRIVNRQVYDIGKIYKKNYGGVKLKAGQVVCIEPMVTCGKDAFGTLHSDGWSHITRDNEYSAMFEHMILVTEEGFEVLTDHFNEEGIT